MYLIMRFNINYIEIHPLEWIITQVEFYRKEINQLHRKKTKHTCCNDDNEEDNDHLKLRIDKIEKEDIQLKTRIGDAI